MKIIGLSGVARSGKDTASGFALEWCAAEGYKAERVALADPLKVSAARALGFQGASTLGSPEETAECVAFCNTLKQPDVTIHVSLFHPGSTGPEPEPPEWEPLTEITGRQFLQFYGTEAHRDVFGEDFWTNVTRKILVEKEAAGIDIVFITDVRFPDEARFVYSEDDWDGEVWAVERPGAGLSNGLEAHASEAGLPPEQIALVIDNAGKLEDLRDQVRLVCEDRLEVVA